MWNPGLLNLKWAPFAQTLDGAIHRINNYPADENHGNQLRYPLNTDLSSGKRYPPFEQPRADHEIRNFTNDWNFGIRNPGDWNRVPGVRNPQRGIPNPRLS